MRRLFFMSPAEARFIELLGGHVIRIKRIKHPRNGFPLTIYWRMGKILGNEKFKREVRIGKYFVDFCNDLGWIVEIDGRDYHMDVVADLEREGYIIERGFEHWLRIPAHRLWRDPAQVQRDTLKFFVQLSYYLSIASSYIHIFVSRKCPYHKICTNNLCSLSSFPQE